MEDPALGDRKSRGWLLYYLQSTSDLTRMNISESQLIVVDDGTVQKSVEGSDDTRSINQDDHYALKPTTHQRSPALQIYAEQPR